MEHDLNLEKLMFEKKMRAIQTNSETVKLTLRNYEDMKRDIAELTAKINSLAEENNEIIKSTGNYDLSTKFSKFAYGNCYFTLKTGINQEIDELREENKKLKDKLNKQMSLTEKIKYLFS